MLEQPTGPQFLKMLAHVAPCRKAVFADLILEIEEVKGYFNESDSEDRVVHDGMGANTTMLFNFEPQATKDDFVDGLPPRETVDKLVFRAFNSSSSTQRECALKWTCCIR
jgi:hypothetical protein